MIAEGVTVVRRLLDSPYPPRAVFGVPAKISQLAVDVPNAPCYAGSADLMAQVVGFHLNRGVLATADRAPVPSVAQLITRSHHLAILEGINDHENLGGLFRNAAALGVDGVLLGPRCEGFRQFMQILDGGRISVAAMGVGLAQGAYDLALAYAKEREQFGRPIAGFQLVQEKLVWMVQEITKAQLLALRLTRMLEAGHVRPAQISLAKRNNVWMALECARKARDVLGAAGITDRYSVIRHLMNLESVYTYEGTHDIHTLVVAEDITGL